MDFKDYGFAGREAHRRRSRVAGSGGNCYTGIDDVASVIGGATIEIRASSVQPLGNLQSLD
jgi:hypothetical protein